MKTISKTPVALGLLGGLALAPAPLLAQDGVVTAAADPPAASVSVAGVDITGSLDAYVSVNPARGSMNDAPNDLRAFDLYGNQAAFSLGKLAFERKAEPVGFRFDLGFGPTIDLVNEGDALGPAGDAVRFIQQAYVEWQAAPTVSIKFGKMVTHHGFEVIESQDNWNYSQGLLFTWAIPFHQTGLAVTWAASDQVEATFFLVNGLNNTFDDNAFKSPGLQLALKPADGLELLLNYSAFNELPGAAGGIGKFGDAVHLFDVVAQIAVTPDLELALNADVGIDTAIDAGRTHFGVAGFGRYHLGKPTNVALRGEVFRGSLSPTLGAIADEQETVTAFTGTFSHAPATGLLLRAEARLDQALGDFEPFTTRDGSATASQFTLTFGAVAMF